MLPLSHGGVGHEFHLHPYGCATVVSASPLKLLTQDASKRGPLLRRSTFHYTQLLWFGANIEIKYLYMAINMAKTELWSFGFSTEGCGYSDFQ